MISGQREEFSVSISFDEQLRELLRERPKDGRTDYRFFNRRSIKDLLESLGIPHTEIGFISINDEPSAFDRIVENGDLIDIRAASGNYNLRTPSLLRNVPLQNIRFILDVHLGTLARRLRLLGFDTDYLQGRDDPELATIAAEENRILLSRDRQLLMRGIVQWGLLIRNTDPFLQTAEVVNRLDLWDEIKAFSRCIACNGKLYSVTTGSDEYFAICRELPSGITSWCTEYVRCEDCQKIYWRGSHFDEMLRILGDLSKERTFSRNCGTSILQDKPKT